MKLLSIPNHDGFEIKLASLNVSVSCAVEVWVKIKKIVPKVMHVFMVCAAMLIYTFDTRERKYKHRIFDEHLLLI